MSKQWYYEAMGAPVGPITSTELKACVLARRISPETRIRLGDDGKWQTADRVKGLFDAPVTPPAPAKPAAPSRTPTVSVTTPTAAETGTAEISTIQTAELTIPVAGVTPALSVSTGTASPAADDDSDTDYDFFKFVGFENAIGHALNDVLREYCRVHHVTMTQATRRALADFLGRKDLNGDPPAAAPAPESFGVG
ncbi:hypothetical protein Pan44_03250 [Caulifigura coniformis]|uniref:GYF domain-containing protein n=1 Tax=Caulifigura coniformis TaxID=2527983 RepID=A0A517S866_9PLAN|nr:DUF4339 domain-containing protein [Caulifigura coniformis]QDT52316.1 hypothetical protein Pan44_03250 [Caulifigura coniformis]